MTPSCLLGSLRPGQGDEGVLARGLEREAARPQDQEVAPKDRGGRPQTGHVLGRLNLWICVFGRLYLCTKGQNISCCSAGSFVRLTHLEPEILPACHKVVIQSSALVTVKI